MPKKKHDKNKTKIMDKVINAKLAEKQQTGEQVAEAFVRKYSKEEITQAAARIVRDATSDK